MKKKIIFLILSVCVIGIFCLFFYQNQDPSADVIEEMQIMKFSPNQMANFDGIYIEKDKNRINTILTNLKKRNREDNTVRINTNNYIIDMMVKDKKNGDFKDYRYDIWVENDGVFVTMPNISAKSYKIQSDSAKVIQSFLDNIKYKI